jgi:hypothetical protein
MTFYLPADLDAGDGNTTIVDAIGNIEWNNANPVNFTYDAAARQLQRIQGGNTVILANDVDSVLFEDLTTQTAQGIVPTTLYNNEIKITLTLRRTTPQGRPVAATAIEIVKLRN